MLGLIPKNFRRFLEALPRPTRKYPLFGLINLRVFPSLKDSYVSLICKDSIIDIGKKAIRSSSAVLFSPRT